MLLSTCFLLFKVLVGHKGDQSIPIPDVLCILEDELNVSPKDEALSSPWVLVCIDGDRGMWR